MTLRRVSLFAAAAVTASASTAGAQAPLGGVRYRLELDLTAQDSAPGRVVVSFQRAAGAGDLVLDFRGPRLGAVTANGEAVTDGAWENGHLRIPARHLRDGENTIGAAFT